jgi:hypothetical protein
MPRMNPNDQRSPCPAAVSQLFDSGSRRGRWRGRRWSLLGRVIDARDLPGWACRITQTPRESAPERTEQGSPVRLSAHAAHAVWRQHSRILQRILSSGGCEIERPSLSTRLSSRRSAIEMRQPPYPHRIFGGAPVVQEMPAPSSLACSWPTTDSVTPKSCSLFGQWRCRCDRSNRNAPELRDSMDSLSPIRFVLRWVAGL